jgi:hypothetical protein
MYMGVVRQTSLIQFWRLIPTEILFGQLEEIKMPTGKEKPWPLIKL